MNINPQRGPGESFDEYRARRAAGNRAIRNYLLLGMPAKTARDGRKYVPGSHRTHQPREIKKEVPMGNGKKRTFSVTHPGTLVKAPA